MFQSVSAKTALALSSQSLIAASSDSSCELLKPGPLPVNALSPQVYPLGGPDGTGGSASASGDGAAALAAAQASPAPRATAQIKATFGIGPPPGLLQDGLPVIADRRVTWDWRRHLLQSPPRIKHCAGVFLFVCRLECGALPVYAKPRDTGEKCGTRRR